MPVCMVIFLCHAGNLWGICVNPTISIQEARAILGTTAKGLSDEAIKRLVAQVEILTDIVVAHASGSKIHRSIDIPKRRRHTDG